MTDFLTLDELAARMALDVREVRRGLREGMIP